MFLSASVSWLEINAIPDLQPGQIGWLDLTVGEAESLQNFYGQRPQDLRRISPRDFEMVLAELLAENDP